MHIKKQLSHLRYIKSLKKIVWLDFFCPLRAAAAHEGYVLGLHFGMIIPTIKNQASEEQQKKWLPMAESMRMIATYAQTELGHGWCS